VWKRKNPNRKGGATIEVLLKSRNLPKFENLFHTIYGRVGFFHNM
jgi:hypothetical protein